jgi:hypothetical protein
MAQFEGNLYEEEQEVIVGLGQNTQPGVATQNLDTGQPVKNE